MFWIRESDGKRNCKQCLKDQEWSKMKGPNIKFSPLKLMSLVIIRILILDTYYQGTSHKLFVLLANTNSSTARMFQLSFHPKNRMYLFKLVVCFLWTKNKKEDNRLSN